MRAAVLTAVRRIEVADVPMPSLGPHDVLVKVAANALCGSDVHAFDGTHSRIRRGSWFGHEIAGTVAELGSGVSNVHLGQRVAIDSVLPCGQCQMCNADRGNVCLNYMTTGSRGDGGLAEFVRIPSGNAHPIPDDLTMDAAALLQPMAIAHHAVHERARVQAGELVAIIGAGPIGLLTMLLCSHLGAEAVVTDVRDGRLDWARKLGANEVVDARVASIDEATRSLSDGLGAHHVFDCVGGTSQSVLATCANSARPGGVVTVLGTYSSPEISVPSGEFEKKELTVKSSRSYRSHSYINSLRMIERGDVAMPPLVTHTFPLSETETALAMLSDGDESIVKAVIRPAE